MSSHNIQHLTTMMEHFSREELTAVRDWVDQRIFDDTPGGATSGDSEKKKYIAQKGANPLDQVTAQDVPQPETDEVKDLQNEMARKEHLAKGGRA
jgi:hypothetical protein